MKGTIFDDEKGFRYLRVPLYPIVLWDLDAWSSKCPDLIDDTCTGLAVMLKENLETCRANDLTTFEFDEDTLFAVMYSKMPWLDARVEQLVFDMDIFGLRATNGLIRQLMLIPPPSSYTSTEAGMEDLLGMNMSQIRDECKEATIHHLDGTSLVTYVREPIKLALRKMAIVAMEYADDESNDMIMNMVYQKFVEKRFTSEELNRTTFLQKKKLFETYVDHEKRKLMRKKAEIHRISRKTKREENEIV